MRLPMGNAKKSALFLTTLTEALKAEQNDRVLTLLREINVQGVIDSRKTTVLHLSAAAGNVYITQYLVKCGCTIDAEDENEITPLLLAMYFFHLKVIRILVDAGADLSRINSKNASPVLFYNLGGDDEHRLEIYDIFRSALKSRQVSIRRLTPSYFIAAALRSDDMEYTMHGNETLMNVFSHKIASIFNIATANKKFFPAASVAVQMLLSYGGADLNIKNHKGETPLHVAAQKSNTAATTWLLNRGADVNARNNKTQTPLCIAVALLDADATETVEVLLCNGADLHTISSTDETILEASKRTIKNVRTTEVILRRLALSEVRGEPLNKRDLQILKSDNKMKTYYERCKVELQDAKKCKLLDGMTLYELLSTTKNFETLTHYAKNRDFREQFTKLNISKKFPIFSTSYLSKLIECVNLRNINDQATGTLREILPFLDDLIVREVIKFLTTKERRLLAQ